MLDTSEDRNQPRFTQPEVLRATGLKPATLQTWANRGLVQPANPAPGTGQRRMYSALQVFEIAVMAKLVTFGVAASRAATMAEDMADGCNREPIEIDLFTFVYPPQRENGVRVTARTSRGREYSVSDFPTTTMVGNEWEIMVGHALDRSPVPSEWRAELTGDPRGGETAALVIHTGRLFRDTINILTGMIENER